MENVVVESAVNYGGGKPELRRKKDITETLL